MAAVIRQATRLAKHSFRYSSNAPLVVAADLPKVAPYDGIPFAASPEDTTKGELGQVELPSMQEYWTEEMTIPSEPDNYTAAPAFSSTFPSFHSPKLHTVASPSTHITPPVLTATAVPSTQPTPQGPEHGKVLSAIEEVFGVKIGAGEVEADKFEYVKRDLTGEEKLGVWTLVGILVGGWLAGGIAEKKK